LTCVSWDFTNGTV